MHEVATSLMRSTPNWTELATSDANFAFQYQDALMTIFPDGSWRCVIPQGLTEAISQGNVNNLDQFLKAFALANPL
jgi:hypothetical protein